MVANFITPYLSIFNVPEMYTKSIPSQKQLDGIKISDIVLIGVRTGLEDSWYTEFFALVVTDVKEGFIKGTVPFEMKLTVNHGIRKDSEVCVYEDHVFAILSEEECIDLFE